MVKARKKRAVAKRSKPPEKKSARVESKSPNPLSELMLRTSMRDGTSWGGFVWPASGMVEPTHWSPHPSCGDGLHGLYQGCGDASLLIRDDGHEIWQLVAVDPKTAVDLGGKVKVPRGEVVYSGDQAGAIKILLERYPALPFVGKPATAGTRGSATAGDEGSATAGYAGSATAGTGGSATAGTRGSATAGYAGSATAGDEGSATAGTRGSATAGYAGSATAGDEGSATAGTRGSATAGYAGSATAGDEGSATAGTRGSATAGYAGSATAGDEGSATAGDAGAVAAGLHAVIVIRISSSAPAIAVVDGVRIPTDTWCGRRGREIVPLSSPEIDGANTSAWARGICAGDVLCRFLRRAASGALVVRP